MKYRAEHISVDENFVMELGYENTYEAAFKMGMDYLKKIKAQTDPFYRYWRGEDNKSTYVDYGSWSYYLRIVEVSEEEE